jgi:VanZ like family/Concanavalin A-like lectin/glucanases superfamily
VQFAVKQSGDDLFVLRDIPDEQNHVKSTHIAIDHVFQQGQELLIAITSDAQGTTVYINGISVKTVPQFRIARKDFTGRLVIANSPIRTNTWGGQLWGLAIYNNKLTSAQVGQHYHSWREDDKPDFESDGDVLARYRFGEHAGRVVHNEVAIGPNLYIPEYYFVLHGLFLTPPWKEFEATWTYWKDVALNIIAFIPLGFLLSAYWSMLRIKRAAAAAIVFGCAVSLTIEILQGFLPTRNSGMTDLLTNGFGTALGAGLYVWLTKHSAGSGLRYRGSTLWPLRDASGPISRD